MVDKELITYAALAAGINGEWELDPNFLNERWQFMVSYDNQNMMTSFEWNPLREDGDALRLAVKLQIRPDWGVLSSGKAICRATWLAKPLMHQEKFICAVIDGDIFTATRHVIVRAAAEIGKNLTSSENGKTEQSHVAVGPAL